MRLDETLAALSHMPEALAQRLAGLSDSQLRAKPNYDSFSLLEHICHLRDIEVEGYCQRLRRLLQEDKPVLPDLDGTALARERDYNRQTLAPALTSFIEARRENLAALTHVGEAQLTRSGQLENVGVISLGRLLELWVQHDSEHLKEVDELLLRSGR